MLPIHHCSLTLPDNCPAMRLRSLVFSALALGGVSANLACTDEERGVIEPPYLTTGGSGNDTGAGGKATGGTSSSGGKPSGANGGKGNNPGAGDEGPVERGGDGNLAPAGDCALPWSEGSVGADDSCDLDNLQDGGIVIQGEINSDLTLPGGKSYKLSGGVRVGNGAVLTIGPCTKILGSTEDDLLLIAAGSKIEAKGTADAPIVFTSDRPKGSRAPGDWGGLIILGNARTNAATDIQRPAIEGLVASEFYGSANDDHNDESSGTLEYVRVEYVGKDLGFGNEVNGITFGAVGSGTKVSHVQVANCTDDCFEWFGGTMNADHLVALNCDDDSFDTDNGFAGHVQFAFARQFPVTSESDSNGFEMDTGPDLLRKDPNDATMTLGPYLPQTTARWSNVTLCGEGPSDSLSPPRFGAVLRRLVAGTIENTILTGFADGGVSFRDASPITLQHSLVFGNGADGTVTLDPTKDWPAFSEPAWSNASEAPAGFCDCWSNPPAPFPLSPVAGVEPTDFDDPSASYVGAFEQADVASNWLIGKWVSWDSE